jgi:rod shape determining protein RodA
MSWRFIATVAGAIAALAPIAWFYVLEDYQKGRLISFIDPKADPTAAYNVAQSKAAIGSGQLTGKGLLASQVYVPAKRTDFIFSAVTETFGFIGAALVLIAFALLIFRLFRLANNVKDPFGSYIIIGVMAMTAFHTFENIGMSMGLMPVTGIPLPLVSYGGSNLLANMLAFGIVLNIAMRNKKRSNLGMARNFTTI